MLRLFAIFALLMCGVVAGPARAVNLITNGDFELISAPKSSIFGNLANPWGSNSPSDGVQQIVTGWNTAGFNLLMRPGESDTVGAVGPFGIPFKLWGPGTGEPNGLTGSPTGGNYIVADGAYRNAPIVQTITGLTIGETYQLKFSWAAAQQQGFNGATTEGWTICFGTCSFTFGPEDGYAMYTSGERYSTQVVPNANHGFVPWRDETMYFKATSTTQTLSLLAYGTPVGQPPFALIDGLRMEAGVPEPETWAMMLIGFGLIGANLRIRNMRRARRSGEMQIV